MPLPQLPLLCMGGIVCLTPLTLYLFWLSAVNRRDRPTVVSSRWDFVSLLSALGGFLLCVGLLLSSVATKKNPLLNGANVRDNWENVQIASLILPVGYLLLVLACAALTLQSRRKSLSVYNIDRTSAEATFRELFTQMGIDAKRFGNVWSDTRPLIEVVPFPAFSHLTVKILATDERLNEELERELRTALVTCSPGESPAGVWLSTAATSAFVSVMCCVILIVAASISGRL